MNFYVKVFFSASVIAASVKPCIVNVLHIPFQNTPEPGALDLYFTFLVILPDAGAISTSAEFLFSNYASCLRIFSYYASSLIYEFSYL